MKLIVADGAVPAGQYLAKFLGIEDTSHPEYGAGLRFQFEICSGEQLGKKVSRITSASPTLTNIAGKLLSGLVGHQLTRDEGIDVDRLVGQTYTVEVETTEKGATRVGAVQLSSSV